MTYEKLNRNEVLILNRKALTETKNDYLDQLDEMLELAKSEKRSFTGQELRMVEALKVSIADIERQLQEDEIENRDIMKEGKVNMNEKEQRALIEKEEREFIDFIKYGESRASNLPSGTNGAVIPKTIAHRIINRAKEISPLFASASITQVKGQLVIPTYNWQDHTTAYQGAEFTAISSSASVFGNVTLDSIVIGSLSLISKKLINMADIDVIPFVVNQLALSMVNFLEQELLKSPGTAGLLRGLATGVVNSVPGITTLTLTVDELVDVQMAIKTPYQENAMWIIHPTTWKLVRKLKDTTGQLLIGSLGDGQGFQLLGKPVYLSENIDAIGVNKRCIYYGDANGLAINIQNQEVSVMQEKYNDQYAIGVVQWMQLDSAVCDDQAFSVYVGK